MLNLLAAAGIGQAVNIGVGLLYAIGIIGLIGTCLMGAAEIGLHHNYARIPAILVAAIMFGCVLIIATVLTNNIAGVNLNINPIVPN